MPFPESNVLALALFTLTLKSEYCWIETRIALTLCRIPIFGFGTFFYRPSGDAVQLETLVDGNNVRARIRRLMNKQIDSNICWINLTLLDSTKI